MPLADCIKKLKISKQDADFILGFRDQRIKEGLEEGIAEFEALNDFSKKLNGELNVIRKAEGLEEIGLDFPPMPTRKKNAEAKKQDDGSFTPPLAGKIEIKGGSHFTREQGKTTQETQQEATPEKKTKVKEELKQAKEAGLSERQQAGLKMADRVLTKVREDAPRLTDKHENEIYQEIKANNTVKSKGKDYRVNWTEQGVEIVGQNGKALNPEGALYKQVLNSYKSRINKIASQAVEKANSVDFDQEQPLFKPGEVKGSRLSKLKADQRKVAANLRKFGGRKGRLKPEEQKTLEKEYNRLQREIDKEIEKRSGKTREEVQKSTEKPVTQDRKGLGQRFQPESLEDRIAEELTKGVDSDGIIRMLGKNRTKDDKGILLNYSDNKSGRKLDDVAQQLADEFNMDALEVMDQMEAFMQENPKSAWDYIAKRVAEQEDPMARWNEYQDQSGEFDPQLAYEWLEENDPEANKAMMDQYFEDEQFVNEQIAKEYEGSGQTSGEGSATTQGDQQPTSEGGQAPGVDVGNDQRNEGKQKDGKGVSGTQDKAGKQYSKTTVMSQDSQGNVFASTDRVQPDLQPTGRKPKKLKDITLNLAKNIGQRIFKNRTGRRNSIGSYNPRTSAVVVRYRGDLDTTAHEIGHALDDRFGIISDIPPAQAREIRAELVDNGFSEYGSTPPKGHPDPMSYKLSEGIAEWIRAYVINPSEAIRRAPETYRRYQEVVPEKIRQRIDEFGQDVRDFTGALNQSAHDVMMSNIQMEPEKKKGTIWEMLKPTATDGSNFYLTLADKMKAVLLNSLHPFNRAVRYAMSERGGGKLRPEENPEMLARLFLGASEKFDNILQKGWVNSKNEREKDPVTGKPINLEFLLEPFDQTNEQTIKDEMEEAVTLMVAERTLEKRQLLGKESISGVGGGIFKDAEVAQKRLDQFEQQPQDKKDRIREAARRYRVFADAGLQYMVQKGRISEEQYDMIKAENTYYVAMQRIMDAGDGEEITVHKTGKVGNKIGVTKDVLPTFKGSTRVINNPYSTLLDSAQKMMKESDRNEIMDAFVDLLEVDRGMNDGRPSNLGAIGTQVASSGPNTITVFRGGEKQHWQLDDDVYKAINGLTDTGVRLPRFATAFARLLRWSVTHAPQFAVRNRIRDVSSRLILSRGNAFSGFDIHTNKGAKKQAQDGYQLFGGGQGGYHLLDEGFYHKTMAEEIQRLSKSKNTFVLHPGRLAKLAWKGYEGLLESGERAGRLEEFQTAYKKAKKEGMDDYNAQLYAAYQSRDLMDFAVAGTWMKVVNQVIPFSNAAVQGLRRSAIAAQENPAGFATKMVLYSMLPAIANHIIVSQMGEEKEKEYEDMPAYQRDLFYNIPVGTNLWVAIPKPFELGMLGSFTDRAISYFKGNDKAFDGHAGSVARSIMPFDETALFPVKPLAEIATNRDFFRGKSIIPGRDEKVAVALRDTGKASRLGKAIQSISLDNFDARMADQFIKSSTSYFGTAALKLSDLGRDDGRYDFNLGDLGVFKQSPAYNSQPVQWVLENYAKYDLASNKDARGHYKVFNQYVEQYFNSKTDEEKAKTAEAMRDFSKRLRAFWESAGLITTDK